MTTNRPDVHDLHGIYSDVYKDTFGVRPRHDVRAWDADDFEAEIDSLLRYQQLDREHEERRLAEAAVDAEFENPASGPGWKFTPASNSPCFCAVGFCRRPGHSVNESLIATNPEMDLDARLKRIDEMQRKGHTGMTLGLYR